jgi:hypothetical protein
MKKTPLQQEAFDHPWTDDREELRPALLLLPGGLAIGLSLNL